MLDELAMTKNLFAEIKQVPRKLGTVESLTARLIARIAIIALSLVINSWAIAAMAPALPLKQSSTAHQALSTNTLSINFVPPKRIKKMEPKSETKTKKTSSETQKTKPKKKAVSNKQRREKNPPRRPILLGSASAKNSVENQHADLSVSAGIIEPERLETSPKHETKTKSEQEPETEPEISAVEPLTVPVQTEPSFLEPPKPPRYPSLARKRGQQGTVLLELWLDETGHQTKLRVSQSSGVSTLDKAAIAAVAKWRFQAHRLNGLSVASRVTVPLEFVLN